MDVRLRRQNPVSVKPPRLRLSATNSTSTAIGKGSACRLSVGAQPQGKGHTRGSSASNNKNNNTCDGRSGKSHDGAVERVVPRSSRSSSVSKISGSSSCGRRIRGRASRAGITASTFTPAVSSLEGLSSGNSQSLAKSVTTGLSRSCENVRTAVFSTATSESGSSSSRPLIHHQRHNLKNRFQLLKTLGEGTYGKVKLAVEKSCGEQVAIKYIKKTKIVDGADLARIRREIQILSSLRHSHVVNIREVFEKKDKIVLVMDYAQGGELYDYLNKMGRLGEWEARRIFRQIVSAIHCCHQNGIVHRDLKLENIILDDAGNVKIADFGLANYYSHSSLLSTFCGSPLYASPEIVNGRSYYGPEVDVWSLGVILYTLVYGSMPFESNSLVSLKQQISDGEYRQPSKPSDAAGLIRHMLTATPSRRATMEDALRHWWVNFGHAHMPNGQPYNPCDLQDTRVQLSGPLQPASPGNPTSGVAQGNGAEPASQRESFILSPPAPACDGRSPVPQDQVSLDNSLYQRPRCHSLDDTLQATRSEEFVMPPPPAIIHQRNQSSLSSDSDAELELLRSSQWDQCQSRSNVEGHHRQPQQHPRRRSWRFGHQKPEPGSGGRFLDSTGNSVNSSGSASPASNPEDSAGGQDGGDTQQHRKSAERVGQQSESMPSVLKLPTALVDILGSCSEKSLAALLTPDPDTNLVSFNPFNLLDGNHGDSPNNNPPTSDQSKNTLVSSSTRPVSHRADGSSSLNTSDVTNNNVCSSTHSSQATHALSTSLAGSINSTSTSSTADTFVFDSERKPKRSILKRRGKFSGPDPAKTLEKGQIEDSHIPKSGGGHLPRRLPSFRDEAHGIFSSKHRASQLLEEAAGTLAPESCSNALLHSHHTPWGKHCVHSSIASYIESTSQVPFSSAELPHSPPLSQAISTHPDSTSPGQHNSTPCHMPPRVIPHPHPTAPVPKHCLHHASLLGPSEYQTSSSTTGQIDWSASSTLDHQTEHRPSQSYNVDVVNGNFPTHLANVLVKKENCPTGDSRNDRDSPTSTINGQVNETQGQTSLTHLLSALSMDSAGSSSTSSSLSPAKPAKSSHETKTTSTDGSCANSYFSAPTPAQSANNSNRSSASNSSGDSAYDSSCLSSQHGLHLTTLSASSVTKVVRRSGSSQLEKARNRLSVSSIGSNSSADILDLSYDSGDSDHFINLEKERLKQAGTQAGDDISQTPTAVDLDQPVSLVNKDSCAILPDLCAGHSIQGRPGLDMLPAPWSEVCGKSEPEVSQEVDLMIFPDDEDEEVLASELSQNRSMETTLGTITLGTKSSKDQHDRETSGAENITCNVEEGQHWQGKIDSVAETQAELPNQVTAITESSSPLLYRLTREAQTWL